MNDRRKTLEAVVAWAKVPVAGREVRRIRAEALLKMKGGLRALELSDANPLNTAHAALDAAVLTTYGFTPKANLLAQLLILNRQVANRVENGEPITAPGIPQSFQEPSRLVTGDCIEPDNRIR